MRLVDDAELATRPQLRRVRGGPQPFLTPQEEGGPRALYSRRRLRIAGARPEQSAFKDNCATRGGRLSEAEAGAGAEAGSEAEDEDGTEDEDQDEAWAGDAAEDEDVSEDQDGAEAEDEAEAGAEDEAEDGMRLRMRMRIESAACMHLSEGG